MFGIEIHCTHCSSKLIGAVTQRSVDLSSILLFIDCINGVRRYPARRSIQGVMSRLKYETVCSLMNKKAALELNGLCSVHAAAADNTTSKFRARLTTLFIRTVVIKVLL